MNEVLTKSYEAGSTIYPSRFIKHGASDYEGILATSAAVAILGISVCSVGAVAGQVFDVVKVGVTDLELGGTVNRGDILIADAEGKGIAANIVAGVAQHVGAIAEVAGVAGDIIPVQIIAGGVIATDTAIIQADITVSSAELLALNAAPKSLVAAPGAGKGIVLVDAQFFLDYNSAAYAGIAAGEDLALRYTGAAGEILGNVEATGFLDAVADAYRHVNSQAATSSTPVANAPLVLHMATGEVTTGNSPLKVRVRYRVVDLAF